MYRTLLLHLVLLCFKLAVSLKCAVCTFHLTDVLAAVLAQYYLGEFYVLDLSVFLLTLKCVLCTAN